MKASGDLWEVKYRTHQAKGSHEGQGPGIEEIGLDQSSFGHSSCSFSDNSLFYDIGILQESWVGLFGVQSKITLVREA